MQCGDVFFTVFCYKLDKNPSEWLYIASHKELKKFLKCNFVRGGWGKGLLCFATNWTKIHLSGFELQVIKSWRNFWNAIFFLREGGGRLLCPATNCTKIHLSGFMLQVKKLRQSLNLVSGSSTPSPPIPPPPQTKLYLDFPL